MSCGGKEQDREAKTECGAEEALSGEQAGAAKLSRRS